MRGTGTFWVAFLALSVLGATNCAAERPTNRLCEYILSELGLLIQFTSKSTFISLLEVRFGFGACNQNANSRCLSDANCTATQFCFLLR